MVTMKEGHKGGGRGPSAAGDAETAHRLAIAIEAVDAAGHVIRPFFRSCLDAVSKGDESPVTIADRSAEEAIRAILSASFPDHGLIGEEHGVERADARFRWVIDPIDGTRAFITGRPIFGTLLALMDGDLPVLGILDQPITGERWIGMKGMATRFIGPFGGQIGVRSCDRLATAELSCTAPDMVADEAAWPSLAAAVRRISWGGDCYAYGLLALGQIDMVAEGGLKPWDWAALQPIVEGAGGRMTDWEGNPLRLSGDGRVLAVGDQRLLPLAVAALTLPAERGQADQGRA